MKELGGDRGGEGGAARAAAVSTAHCGSVAGRVQRAGATRGAVKCSRRVVEPQLRVVEEAEGHGRAEEDCSIGLTSIIATVLTSIIVTVLALPKRNIGNGHESPLLVIVIFVTVINRPLRLLVLFETDINRPLLMMTLFIMVVFKNCYV